MVLRIGEYKYDQVTEDINKYIEWITQMNNNRLTYYTPNNPDSSRSHLLIKIKYTTQENEKKYYIG